MLVQQRQAFRDQPVGVIVCAGCGGWWLGFFPIALVTNDDFECPHCAERLGQIADYLETLDIFMVRYGGWLEKFPMLN